MKREQIAFRVDRKDPELLKRLELADKLGVNVSEAIRESLPSVLDKKIKQRMNEMRDLLEAVPA